MTPSETVASLLDVDRELLALITTGEDILAWGPEKDVPRVGVQGLSFYDKSETERRKYWSSLQPLLSLGIVQEHDNSTKTMRRYSLSAYGAKVKAAMASLSPQP